MMKKIVFIFVFVFFSLMSYAQEVTTYYFIRHAEKQRQNLEDKDPSLTFEGYQRAEKWKDVFQYIPLDAVYSTDYNRTKLTAKPTADSKELPILVYDPSNMYTESFQYNTKGKQVLIVGHSDTTPAFINKVINQEKYGQIDDDNNSNLYIVTIVDGKPSTTVLKID